MSTPKADLLAMINGFQSASILMAACELDLFSAINEFSEAPTVQELAESQKLDLRGLDVLLSALVALGFLSKESGRFQIVSDYEKLLCLKDPETIVPMIRHLSCCQRSWSQLAWAVKAGIPAPVISSLNGPLADYQSFIGSMNIIGTPLAAPLVKRMKEANLLSFTHLLDLGGASGTYTLAFLNQCPQAQATIFDLPIAIQEARKNLASSQLASQIQLVAGNFYFDEFPTDVDFIWISAIIHQHDLKATEEMFCKSYRALTKGGRIAIRDIFFSNEERTNPKTAALFGVNMLAKTKTGRVYTCEEVFELLTKAGFVNPQLAIPAEDMSAVIIADKVK